MKQYNDIKSKYPDTILLFRVGDFYETFGEDAILASKILGIVLTKRGAGSTSETELAGFPHHSIENYLPKLVKAGNRVAICDQLEDPKLTKKIVKRGVTEIVTPGIAINDGVLDQKKNNYLASIHIEKTQCGISFLDVSTGDFYVSQGDIKLMDQLIANFSTVVSRTLLSSDIGPANCLSDDLCNYFFKKKFDNDGNYARKGKIDNKLIEKFKKDKFFKKKFPKSLDRNYFRNYFNKLIKLNKYDALMTANYMTYIGFKELLKNKKFKIERILLTGGGRKNKLLKEILINKLNKKIELIDKYKINGDLVEAQMFAYIGMRSFKNLEISNKNTTGVKKNLSGGILYFPD